MSEMNNNRKQLLARLEAIIGNECYNGNIQNFGPGGQWEGEGREFRYPLSFVNEHRVVNKIRGDASHLPYEQLKTAYYAFGANQLHIVLALEKVLAHLEKEHGLKIEESSP